VREARLKSILHWLSNDQFAYLVSRVHIMIQILYTVVCWALVTCIQNTGSLRVNSDRLLGDILNMPRLLTALMIDGPHFGPPILHIFLFKPY